MTFDIFKKPYKTKKKQYQKHSNRNELKDMIHYFDAIILSPGPGTPELPQDFMCSALLLDPACCLPLLGICLGYQGLGYFYGAKVKTIHNCLKRDFFKKKV
jgi:anthranilate/para-aminobenzoate synthase component II